MPLLESDKEVKSELQETIAKRVKLNPLIRENRGARLKFVTTDKLLIRLPKLLAQTKPGNNSYKLKTEIREIVYLFYQHNEITKRFIIFCSSHFNNGRKYNCDKRSQNFIFWYDWPKDVDENLKHKAEFIIKSNKALAKKKAKNEIEQLLSKCKHGNNIHENRKQQNEQTA